MGSTQQESLLYPARRMKKTEHDRLLDYRRLGVVTGGIATTLQQIHV